MSELPRGGRKRLAIRLGVSASYLSRLASGDRSITAERAIQIEDATDGSVSRADVRPDIKWGKSKRPQKPKPGRGPTMNETIRPNDMASEAGRPSVYPSSAGGVS
ncbi:YdaS family helix-turn-helix protein [Pseudomonas fulva]|uniref:transcriptional regulator n=1 Tax=Pseudomonas fulva TaxID=47880 RepID=UPI0031F66663